MSALHGTAYPNGRPTQRAPNDDLQRGCGGQTNYGRDRKGHEHATVMPAPTTGPGRAALVATSVAMALAASWIPFVNENVNATAIASTNPAFTVSDSPLAAASDREARESPVGRQARRRC